MELSVFNRLILLNILPKEGDFTTLKIVRQMREDLSFNEEEVKLCAFKHSGETVVDENGVEEVVPEGQIKWRELEKPKDITLGEKATDIIVETLKQLDKGKKLTDQHYGLFEKFVEK